MASPNTRIDQLEKHVALLMQQKGIDPPQDKPNKSKSTKTKAKAKTKSEDDDKPKKKRTSGYILFSNANRDEVKERLNDDAQDGEKPKNTEIMKELARMWKELDDDEKTIWNNKAKATDSDDE